MSYYLITNLKQVQIAHLVFFKHDRHILKNMNLKLSTIDFQNVMQRFPKNRDPI